jgi:hypothetical protein
MEGSSRAKFKALFRNSPEGSEQPVSRPIFELGTSRIHGTQIAQSV